MTRRLSSKAISISAIRTRSSSSSTEVPRCESVLLHSGSRVRPEGPSPRRDSDGRRCPPRSARSVGFSLKKREHFLTVVFTDDRGVNQVAVLELGKNVVRSTLLTIEERSGTVVEYQDEQARNWR